MYKSFSFPRQIALRPRPSVSTRKIPYPVQCRHRYSSIKRRVKKPQKVEGRKVVGVCEGGLKGRKRVDGGRSERVEEVAEVEKTKQVERWKRSMGYDASNRSRKRCRSRKWRRRRGGGRVVVWMWCEGATGQASFKLLAGSAELHGNSEALVEPAHGLVWLLGAVHCTVPPSSTSRGQRVDGEVSPSRGRIYRFFGGGGFGLGVLWVANQHAEDSCREGEGGETTYPVVSYAPRPMVMRDSSSRRIIGSLELEESQQTASAERTLYTRRNAWHKGVTGVWTHSRKGSEGLTAASGLVLRTGGGRVLRPDCRDAAAITGVSRTGRAGQGGRVYWCVGGMLAGQVICSRRRRGLFDAKCVSQWSRRRAAKGVGGTPSVHKTAAALAAECAAQVVRCNAVRCGESSAMEWDAMRCDTAQKERQWSEICIRWCGAAGGRTASTKIFPPSPGQSLMTQHGRRLSSTVASPDKHTQTSLASNKLRVRDRRRVAGRSTRGVPYRPRTCASARRLPIPLPAPSKATRIRPPTTRRPPANSQRQPASRSLDPPTQPIHSPEAPVSDSACLTPAASRSSPRRVYSGDVL